MLTHDVVKTAKNWQ